jgi:site-specific DNA-methyltransferase (adenine-specific)
MAPLKVGPGPKRTRKHKYVPNLAALNFRPTEDWSADEARSRYEDAVFPSKVDEILYSDCVPGMRSLPEESVDCVVADPPFGLSFDGRESLYNRDERYVRRGYREVEVGDYAAFSKKWMAELPRIMKPQASAWIFSGWTNLNDILNAAEAAGLTLVNHIIWKYQFGVFTRRKFVTSHYHVLFLVKSEEDYFFNKISHYPLDVWEINRTYRKGEVKNGTKLPEELVRRCVDYTTRPGDLILDPFMGNGTTATVAIANFRHFIGFELNSSMKDVIEANVNSIKKGESYVPYSQREDDAVARAKKKFESKTQKCSFL